MKKRLSIVAALGFMTGALLAAGCGGSDTNTNTSSSSFTCCINGSFYECSSSAAVQQCVEGNQSGCTRDSSRDNTCN